MSNPKLIVMSGLPGSGKSTIAEGLSHTIRAPLLSIDPIEAAMWVSGLNPSKTGIAAYKVAQALAAENVQQGLSVVIDAVNPVEAARDMWRSLAHEEGADLFFIEVCCGDELLHKARIESRRREIDGMSEVTWQTVQTRKQEFQPWSTPRLQLDSAIDTPTDLISKALIYLKLEGGDFSC